MVVGEGEKQGVMRGLLVVYSVLIASAGQAGQQAVMALREALSCVGRASSCVEGLNSVVRMQQSRHRKVTQELLDLKRLYWNLRKFRHFAPIPTKKPGLHAASGFDVTTCSN